MPNPYCNPSDLAHLATRRNESFFQKDMAFNLPNLSNEIRGKRILIIGGAGSIGSAVVESLCDYEPSALHVLDLSENNLVELVRNLRSRQKGLSVANFKTLPLDIGSAASEHFLDDAENYDVILNFAALKHVRSEKDYYSLLQMLDTNIQKQAWLLKWMQESNFTGRYFCVSTDKAANPVSLMGASKRIMEHIMFSDIIVQEPRCEINSARFANVAFSNGSLLQGFLYRINKRQPIAVPKDTLRYFVSHQEASEICLLAAFCTPHKTIVIPKLEAQNDAVALIDVCFSTLKHFGLSPKFFSDEGEARCEVENCITKGLYPVVLSERDTSGEKDIEIFSGENEQVIDIGMPNLHGVQYNKCNTSQLAYFLKLIESAIIGRQRISIAELLDGIKSVEPSFNHTFTGKSLDDRM
jgi:nucleoside-diphosphate-sugar epimerase